jgi:restriction system protein
VRNDIRGLSTSVLLDEDYMSGRLPAYTDLFQPVLDALNALGGSATPAEVEEYVAKILSLSDAALETAKEDGRSLFSNRVHWARFYLAKAGYLSSSQRGVWSLTEKGRMAHIDETQLRSAVKKIVKAAGPRRSRASKTIDTEAVMESSILDYRKQVLDILYGISPGGFERLCQRLLRESGFERVTVTGRSGDGGIDGNGVVQVNAFVSFRLLFQCKRYRSSVGPGVVRDFRGAMMGRADKGLILTTGTFTQEAYREATRDGVPPIELVDGDGLISLFEKLEFGLKPVRAFEVDADFFKNFEG